MSESAGADTVLAEVIVRLIRKPSGEEGVLLAHDTTRPMLSLGMLEDAVSTLKKHHIGREKAQGGSMVQEAPADLLSRLRAGPNGRA